MDVVWTKKAEKHVIARRGCSLNRPLQANPSAAHSIVKKKLQEDGACWKAGFEIAEPDLAELAEAALRATAA